MSEFLPQLIQQLFNGLSLGAIYALIAIGYTMVYGIIGMINFAHGEIYMIGAYAGLVTLAAVGTQSGLPVAVLIALMLLVAVLVTGTYGFVVEQIAYKPLRNGPRLVALISAIGMSIFLQNWVALGQGARDMAVPALLPGALRFGDEGGTGNRFRQPHRLHDRLCAGLSVVGKTGRRLVSATKRRRKTVLLRCPCPRVLSAE